MTLRDCRDPSCQRNDNRNVGTIASLSHYRNNSGDHKCQAHVKPASPGVNMF